MEAATATGARVGFARRARLRVRGGGPLAVALFAVAALVVLVALAPIGFLIDETLGAGWDEIQRLLFRPFVGRLLVSTAELVAVGTVAATVLGVSVAWLIERSDLPWRRFWGVLAALPITVPAFVTSYSWVSITPAVQGFWGATLIVVLAYYPLVYLPVAAVLRGTDPALEEAARSLGLGPWRTFFRVTLPQTRVALCGGALLVAIHLLSEFGAFAMLRFQTFTTAIYDEYKLTFDGASASMLASVLVLLCLVLLVAEVGARGRGRYARVDSGAARRIVPARLGRARRPALGGMTAVVGLGLGLPLGTVVYWLATGNSAGEIDLGTLASDTWSSLRLALEAAVLTTLAALPIALLSVRRPGRLTTLIERAAYLPFALPGITVALALIVLSLKHVPAIYNSATLLLVAYAILSLPLALVAVRAALAQAPPVHEEVARSLGVRPSMALLRVTIPRIAPGLGAAASLIFLATVTELTATLLLAPIGTETLATGFWAKATAFHYGAAAPYAALMVAISAVPTYLLTRRLGGVVDPGAGGIVSAALVVAGLRKSFGPTEVLAGLDLEVPAGSLTAVLGPSGCGKTTLLRIVAGFERPDAGSVHAGGRELAGPVVDVAAERRRIGLVPQEGALFPHLSVAANVGFGLPRRGRAARVGELLELLDLGGLEKRRPDQLSGGQQQRVALARALAPAPEVILLDEPFDALDAGLRAQVRAEVRAALRETDTTGVLVTHDQEEALSLADQVAVMRDGRIVQAGTPREVYAEPIDLEVALFVGDAVVIEAEVEGAVASTALGRLAVEASGRVVGGPALAVLRPEQLLCATPGENGGGALGRVVGVEFYGHDGIATVRLGDGVEVGARCAGHLLAKPGDEVAVSVDGPVRIFPA